MLVFHSGLMKWEKLNLFLFINAINLFLTWFLERSITSFLWQTWSFENADPREIRASSNSWKIWLDVIAFQNSSIAFCPWKNHFILNDTKAPTDEFKGKQGEVLFWKIFVQNQSLSSDELSLSKIFFRSFPVSSYSPPPTPSSQQMTSRPPSQGRQCAFLYLMPVTFREGLKVNHPFLLASSASLLTASFLLICKHAPVSPIS